MKIKYLVAMDVIKNEDGGERTAYGIDVTVENVSVRRISDVFSDKERIIELVRLCNEGNLSPIQIDDVIENEIG